MEGVSLVITGPHPTLKRETVAEMIRQNGGKISSSVSKNTNYLVAGENAGSKLEKAKKLKVTILDESGFIELIGTPQVPPSEVPTSAQLGFHFG